MVKNLIVVCLIWSFYYAGLFNPRKWQLKHVNSIITDLVNFYLICYLYIFIFCGYFVSVLLLKYVVLWALSRVLYMEQLEPVYDYIQLFFLFYLLAVLLTYTYAYFFDIMGVRVWIIGRYHKRAKLFSFFRCWGAWILDYLRVKFKLVFYFMVSVLVKVIGLTETQKNKTKKLKSKIVSWKDIFVYGYLKLIKWRLGKKQLKVKRRSRVQVNKKNRDRTKKINQIKQYRARLRKNS